MGRTDRCTEGSSYGPVRISFLQCILDALDILCTAVIEGSTEADYKQLVFSDLILDALTDAQKALVEGEEASPEYFGRDTGDASKDDPLHGCH